MELKAGDLGPIKKLDNITLNMYTGARFENMIRSFLSPIHA